VGLVGEVLGAVGEHALVRGGRVVDAQGKAGAARPVGGGELAGEGILRFVDQKVHPALAVERDRLRLVPAHGGEAELLKQIVQQRRIRCGVLDELELLDAEWIGLRLTHDSISSQNVHLKAVKRENPDSGNSLAESVQY